MSLLSRSITTLKILITAFAGALAIANASIAQSKFTIRGIVEDVNSGDSIFLSYRENDQHIVHKVVASNKFFTIEGYVQEPIKASLYRNENPQLIDYTTDYIKLYLESGDITIKGSKSLSSARISGTALNDSFNLLQTKIDQIRSRYDSIKEPHLLTEQEKKDTAFINRNSYALNKLHFEIVDEELAFAEANTDSKISLDILDNRSRINNYVDRVALIYEKLSEQLKQTPQGNEIESRIRKKRMVTVGTQAPNFVLPDSTKKPISLSSLRGGYVLLDFWASWCLPCREGHPNLISLYDTYKDSNFQIVSVSIDKDYNNWISAISEDNLSWPQVSDLKANKSEVYLRYGITSIPSNFLLDPDGIVIAKDLKGEDLKLKLEELLSK